MATAVRSLSYPKTDAVLIAYALVASLAVDSCYRAMCAYTGLDYYSPPLREAIHQVPPAALIVLAVFVQPVLETLAFQAAPIALLHRVFEMSRIFSGLVSASLFGVAHLIYGPAHAAAGLAVGIVFAWMYCARIDRPTRAIALVAVAHGINNVASIGLAVHDGVLSFN